MRLCKPFSLANQPGLQDGSIHVEAKSCLFSIDVRCRRDVWVVHHRIVRAKGPCSLQGLRVGIGRCDLNHIQARRKGIVQHLELQCGQIVRRLGKHAEDLWHRRRTFQHSERWALEDKATSVCIAFDHNALVGCQLGDRLETELHQVVITLQVAAVADLTIGQCCHTSWSDNRSVEAECRDVGDEAHLNEEAVGGCHRIVVRDLDVCLEVVEGVAREADLRPD
mmetsp:Transcript_3837/g.9755  ORF Transcript_3837/g.9755 Transcript_3837/m.9755 type:complete len:223 (-) Transcript_3837:3498-4166(-)